MNRWSLGLPLMAAMVGLSAPIKAQTIVGHAADAQITQGSPNVVTATGTALNVGFGGSSGAMGQNTVLVFPLPNLPSGTGITSANFSVYYSTKDLSGANGPNYNGDLYGLNFATSPNVQPSHYFLGSNDTSAALIQNDFITPAIGWNGTSMSTSDTAGTGGDARLTSYLNTQLSASAVSRALGQTAYVFLRINPDIFGNTYTRYRFYSSENSSFFQPKITYTTGPVSRYFSPTSFWNSPIATAPLDADQSDVQKLVNQVSSGQSIAYGNTWIGIYSYSTPVYIVPQNQPTIAVTDSDDGFMTNVWGQVPWPSSASPAAGTDAHMVIYQPSTDKMWEFFGAGGTYPNPTARHGGKMSNVSTSNGIYPRPYGATATGLPLAGGLITLEEAEMIAADPNYTIPHAIALSVVSSYPDPQYVAPATRADANSVVTANSIKEGRRFRLPPDYDVETELANRPAITKAIARAVKKYGMVVRDITASSVSLYGEDPKTAATDPWPAAFDGTPAYVAVSKNYFPWHRLQVVQPTS